VTHLNGVEELNDLQLEVLHQLQVILFANPLKLRNEFTIRLLWLFNTWEQILNDVLEER
jgi:hypothetical protein